MSDEARDPTTAPERLAALAEQHLDAVLENPAWPQLGADFWRRLSAGTLLALAGSPRCPAALARWASALPAPARVLQALCWNRALPAVVRRQAYLRTPLLLESRARWRAERPDLPELLSTEELSLLDRAFDEAMGHRRDGLSGPEYVQLGELGSWGKAWAALIPQCPGAVLCRILDGLEDPALELHLLSHPALPADRLARALASPDPARRAAALRSPMLTAAQRAAADSKPE